MKYALISGAMGGLAQQIINLLKEHNYHIFALDIDKNLLDKYSNSTQVTPFICDITNDNNLLKVKEKIQTITDQIDLIINFAGIVILGSTIEIGPDKALKLLDINVMGMYRINQMFADLIIKGQGRIINVSSEYGTLTAVPFHSFYTMSKHAVEVYNDSLRRELAALKVKVIKIRPGAFKTKMQTNIESQFNELVNQTNYFKLPLLKMKNMMTKELEKAKDTKKIEKVFKKAIFSKHPKVVYNVNRSFKIKLLSILPTYLQDFIFKKYF